MLSLMLSGVAEKITSDVFSFSQIPAVSPATNIITAIVINFQLSACDKTFDCGFL